MEHTKGNWKEVGAFVMSENNSVDICSTCSINCLPLEEQLANARLIAAAPNLLAACEELANIFPEYSISEMDAADFKDRANTIWVAVQSAKAAIKKAK